MDCLLPHRQRFPVAGYDEVHIPFRIGAKHSPGIEENVEALPVIKAKRPHESCSKAARRGAKTLLGWNLLLLRDLCPLGFCTEINGMNSFLAYIKPVDEVPCGSCGISDEQTA